MLTRAELVFVGNVRARLGGEWLEARARGGFFITELVEPGATWSAAATPNAPQTAWLYLCKPRGVVPRPVRRGTASIGNHPGFPLDGNIMSGALVLSPTPPRIGSSDLVSASGRQWDLRASAALQLPDQTGYNTMRYPWGGMTAEADDCICIGFMRYTGVDTGAGIPLVEGWMYCDEGWFSGEAIAFAGKAAGGGAAPMNGLLAITGANPGLAAWGASVSLHEIAIDGVPRTVPIDGVRAYVRIETNQQAECGWSRRLAGVIEPTIQLGSGEHTLTRIVEETVSAPGRRAILLATVVTSPANVTSAQCTATAVRFPYGEPLAG